MIDYGILTLESHVERLEGRIVEMNPQRAPHAATTQRTSDYLKSQLTDTTARLEIFFLRLNLVLEKLEKKLYFDL